MAAIHFDITGDNKQVLQSLRQTMEAITQLESKTKTAGQNVGKGFGNMGNSVSSTLAGMAAKFLSVTAAIGMFTRTLRSAFEINKNFERKNAELASVLGTTRAGVKELSDAAQALGRTTEFTSTEVTELQIALSRLGFQKGQILEMQGTVLKFAAAVNADLGRAANFAGAALRGFGLEAKDSQHLLDVMAAATSKSALDFSKLETSISIVAPVAHAFGLSVEDTVTLLGALSNAGFDASSAATAARNILLNLADANGKLAKGLGHTARTFPEIIAALKECSERGVDLNTALEMTSTRTVSAWSALTDGAESADELRKALGNVDGTLNDMYTTMTDNLAGAIKQVESAWEGLMLTMQGSTGPLARLLKRFASGLNVITDMIQGTSYKEAKLKQNVDILKEKNLTDEQYEDAIKALEDKLGDEHAYDNFSKALQLQKRSQDKKALAAFKRAYFEIKRDRQLAAIESWANESDGTSGNNNGTPTLTEEEKKEQKKKAEQRKMIERQLQEELTSLVLSNEQERLNLMEEGTRKEVEQIQLNFRKKEEEIKRLGKKWSDENKKAGRTNLNAEGLTAEQTAALDAANNANEVAREKAINDIAKKNREQYLKDYGTYEEKKLAINEEYLQKVFATEDKYEKKSLAKKRTEDLEALRKQYDTSYNLIFADADRLSDQLLSKAILATQQEIVKATKDGKIQELTQLYEKLREQLDVQSSRQGQWGFVGIANAYREVEEASRKLAEAISSGDQASVIEATSEYDRAVSNVEKRAEQVRSTFSDISDILKEMGGTMGEIGSAIGSLADGAKSIMETILGEKAGVKINKGAAISTVFSSAIELGGMLANSIQENKKAQEEWNRSLMQTQHEMTMINLEAMDYKQQNVFGVENPYKKAIDGAKQYSKAMEDLQAETAKLAGGKVQTGQRKAINWANVGKGAAVGASAGAVAGAGIFSGITAGIGAAIGGAAGLITGLFSRKVVPVFESLSSKYGNIVNENFDLNPEILRDYDILDEDTKKLVDNWKEIKDKAKEAEQQMKETFSSLAGDVGSQLSDSLVDAFRNGKLDSAIDDFHEKMNSTIEDIIEQMVFSNVFTEMFDNLEKEMTASFGAGGDNNIVDDLMRFEKNYQQGLEIYSQQMEEAREYMRQNGYSDAFSSESSRTASSRSALGASQDSIDESNGRLTAIQAQVFQMNETVTTFGEKYERLILATAAMLEHTQGIHLDTSELRLIQSDMRELSRQINRNVSQIAEKGVVMR